MLLFSSLVGQLTTIEVVCIVNLIAESMLPNLPSQIYAARFTLPNLYRLIYTANL